jgi:WD40 repeat protein
MAGLGAAGWSLIQYLYAYSVRLVGCGWWSYVKPTCVVCSAGVTQLWLHVVPVQFNYSGSLVLSGSIDATCRLWDVRAGRCLSVKQVGMDLGQVVSYHTCLSKCLCVHFCQLNHTSLCLCTWAGSH